MTREELNTSIDENVTDRTTENPSSAPLIGTEIKKVADYVDERIPVDVVLRITRSSEGDYTVTEEYNPTDASFSASDSSTNGVGITSSVPVFVNGKNIVTPSLYRGGGNPFLTFDNGFLTTSLRLIVFYNVETQAESRPGSFTITVTIKIYP